MSERWLTGPRLGTKIPDMDTLTPNQKLAGLLLGKPVKGFIRERRAAGRSWRLVARDLYEATNGQIDITYQAAKNWAEQDDQHVA